MLNGDNHDDGGMAIGDDDPDDGDESDDRDS